MDQVTGATPRGQGTANKTQKNREKFAFQVLTKDFKNVILILIRKNYLKLFKTNALLMSKTNNLISEEEFFLN
jgi:hypothetical protein